MSRDELIELLSDVTSLVGTALAREVELRESIADAGATAQRLKLDALKAKLAGERLKLQKLNAAAKRRRELEKKRGEQDRRTSRSAVNEAPQSSRRIQLFDRSGRLLGWLHGEQNGRITLYDSKGRVVARESGGLTLDAKGKVVLRGRGGGLVALGRYLGRSSPN